MLPAGHALSAKRRLTRDDLEDEAFILMNEGHCLAGQALQFCRLNGFASRVSFRSAQIETVQAFVASRWGVSIVPTMARKAGAAGVRYRALAGMTRSIGVMTRAGRWGHWWTSCDPPRGEGRPRDGAVWARQAGDNR